ncbi:hypothetical protein EC973_004720 [Apophysomyces ossiformis]|uniref:Uncharacterized protein n=1 Tax=Apophysomyces ossiformis TaxID=679940 RepID=A0A8H7BJW1_9FUNG|nr:hypothetical protein EC973_004720 [Apophysomyces ossiformis]
MVFSKHFTTDGFAVSVSFYKPIVQRDRLPDLTPQDFQEKECMNVCGADPGVTDIYVCSNGSNDVYHDEADLELENDQDIPDEDIVELPEPAVAEGENDDTEFDPHQIRQLSTAEYYTRAGFKKTTQRINTSKTPLIRRLQSEIDTNRTADMDRIIRSIVSTLDALPEVTAFYAQRDIQGLKFYLYSATYDHNCST